VVDLESASVSKDRIKINHISWLIAGYTQCAEENAVIKSFDIIKNI